MSFFKCAICACLMMLAFGVAVQSSLAELGLDFDPDTLNLSNRRGRWVTCNVSGGFADGPDFGEYFRIIKITIGDDDHDTYITATRLMEEDGIIKFPRGTVVNAIQNALTAFGKTPPAEVELTVENGDGNTDTGTIMVTSTGFRLRPNQQTSEGEVTDVFVNGKKGTIAVDHGAPIKINPGTRFIDETGSGINSLVDLNTYFLMDPKPKIKVKVTYNRGNIAKEVLVTSVSFE